MNAGRYAGKTPDNSIIDLILLSNNGSVIGGMELEQKDVKIINPILSPGVGIITTALSPLEVELRAQTHDEMEVVEWQDSHGRFIGDGESVIVTPTYDNNTYSLFGSLNSGEYIMWTVEIPLYSSMDKIYKKGVNEYNVTLTHPAIEGTTIEACGTMTGAKTSILNVEPGNSSVKLDLSGLPGDTYMVVMKVNGLVNDTAKLITQ